MISLTKDKRMLGYESLGSYSNISHFVTTRRGGCGEEAYGTFNCSPYSGDSAEAVFWNQQALLDGMVHRPKELVIPHQVHGIGCVSIDNAYQQASWKEKHDLLSRVDAVMTNVPGYCLCVSTADCVPVLLYDKQCQAVAAVHAGWRGTLDKIVRHTLECMKELYGTRGENVIACIGPSISPESFEVGMEVYEAFQKKDFEMPRISLLNTETGKYHMDLWEANRLQLLEFGVSTHRIEVAGICTHTHHEEFFSARRLGINSGRILSGIMVNENG